MSTGARFITFKEATRLIPSRPHINTIRRWADRGYRGIKLRTVRCGRRRLVPVEAIEEFMRATSGFHAPAPSMSDAPSADPHARWCGGRGRQRPRLPDFALQYTHASSTASTSFNRVSGAFPIRLARRARKSVDFT